MNTSDCIRAAESNISNARRYLESGNAINEVPDSLGTALLWAMEAWLLSNGYKFSHGKGWADTREAFMNSGPAELRSWVISFCAKVNFLEGDLMGDVDDTVPVTPIALWETKAYACLEKADKVINELFTDIR